LSRKPYFYTTDPPPAPAGNRSEQLIDCQLTGSNLEISFTWLKYILEHTKNNYTSKSSAVYTDYAAGAEPSTSDYNALIAPTVESSTDKNGANLKLDYSKLKYLLKNTRDSMSALSLSLSGLQTYQFNIWDGDVSRTCFYKLGTLTLPQNGYQAVITVNLCMGYGFAPNNGNNNQNYYLQNYELVYRIYSSNGKAVQVPTGQIVNNQPVFTTVFTGSSRRCDPDVSLPTGTDFSPGIFHNGYVVCTSPFAPPLNSYLGQTSNFLDSVDIWMQSYAYHGNPMIEVRQNAGSFTRSYDKALALPTFKGYTRLDMIGHVLVRASSNPYNTLV